MTTDLTRPIIGIENRTALEVFDMMCDRFRRTPDISGVWQQARDNHERYSATGDAESDIRFLTLGLTGEAGEVVTAVLEAASIAAAAGRVANLVKKRWRDGDGHDDEIRKEIADTCAYAFMLAQAFGLQPTDLIETIAEKQQVFIAKMETLRAGAAG